MPELLLEVGTEELPASAVRRAYTELGSRIAAGLEEAGILGSNEPPTVLGTPRRLIVSLADVIDRQPDTTKEQRGPGAKAAYDASGNPTQALLGFCKTQGVDPSEARTQDDYVWISKRVKGRLSIELLSELLPKAICSLTFDKTMRWGSGRLRFARPIRWILASFGGTEVAFEIEGVRSGQLSFGHRFYAPDEFRATNLAELTEGLRIRKVEPDPEIRREAIVHQAKAVSAGEPELPDGLIEENTFLTEWPVAIEGRFQPSFLELPPPVLVTAMAKHEKMFPVRTPDGNLTDRFVFIRNSGTDEGVRRGCEWVLNARFNDARFFFDEDVKSALSDFLDKTEGILFQEKLGTVRSRCDRLQRLTPLIAPDPSEPGEAEDSAMAGLYAKADLSTGLVSELASLQGVVGGEYARREGFSDAVSWALASQYDLSKNVPPECRGARVSVRLVMADQLDRLAGYLGIGLEPSGSSDPFALRRAASLLIEAALAWPTRIGPLDAPFTNALEMYGDQGVALDDSSARSALYDLFSSRYSTFWPGVRYDVLQAAIVNPAGALATDPQGIRFRIRVLEALVDDIPFIQTATRPMNIVTAARRKNVEFGVDEPLHRVEHSALESASGLDLFQILSEQQAVLEESALADGDEKVIRMLRRLQKPVNRFFDETMIMVDEPEIRYARLTLMHAVSLQLLTGGDFSKLVIE